ncbi:MAG: hypothetical protein M0Z75_08585 [Nitrospiraceae bacterium]|nr:hypothetical protein [Nitrospiraceae bacterium]
MEELAFANFCHGATGSLTFLRKRFILCLGLSCSRLPDEWEQKMRPRIWQNSRPWFFISWAALERIKPKMKKRIFSDPSIVAFFEASKKPFRIIPQRASNGQVEFLVEGEGIDQALDELYSNRQVGVLDFIKSLKGLRSSIFALKGGRNG